MTQFKRTAIAVGVAQLAMMASQLAFAQAAPDTDSKKGDKAVETVVVVGQRAALASAQKIKQDAEEVVDSIVADDIGKLPDKSVTEVLQRVAGVTIDRTMNRLDPQQGVGDGVMHFAAEGTGVSIRGMSYVRSELNGRDAFSANGGRSLSFEDVPPELMAGVDVYKDPYAEHIEGAIGGLVNLRTAMPFDFKGRKGAISVEESRSSLRKKGEPSFSGMLSNRWNTRFGQVGALIDVARSKIATRSDGLSISPYFPRTDAVVGDTSNALRWLPAGGSWNSNNFDRTRDGLYGALQWKKGNFASGLTYFRSRYKMYSTEASSYTGANPATLTLDPGATFDSSGALLKGTLRAPQDPGVGFGTDSRSWGRTAETHDVAWNLRWNATDQWTFTTDLQHTGANTKGYDNMVGLQGYMPKETVDLSQSPPQFTFDASDRAFLADPANYYWGSTQEHRDHAVATQNAARIDAKFTFDSPVLNDLRFGVRMTDRNAVTQSTHDSEWAEITQPWAVGNSWQPLSQLAYLSDPRFAGNNSVHVFDNFYNGSAPMPPAIVVPNLSLTNGTADASPPAFPMLHDITSAVCKATCTWTPASFGDDKGLNEQRERTKAAYGQLRFGYDRLRYPVDGNIGVRVVHTDMTASGFTLFTPPDTSKLPTVPVIPGQSAKQDFHNSYTNVLPSLNLRMKVNSELQFRFALSKGLTRPDFSQMQAYTTLQQTVMTHQDATTQQSVVDAISYTGSARGNPMLKPTRANNLDLTAEYYFGPTSSLTLAVFDKSLQDIIIGRTSTYTLLDTSGQPHAFSVTSPVNDAKGRVHGLELGYQQYFDKLPGWMSGFGVSGNFTYINSHMDMTHPVTGMWCTPSGTVDANLARDLAGCDTDGRLLGNVPMTGMSKTAYNIALLYDKGPWSARVAYGWRSKYLQAINTWGTANGDGIDRNPDSPNFGKAYSVNYALPTWGGAYGEVDMGMQYKASENLTISFEGQNVNSAIYRQYMQQHIGMKERASFATGPRYSIRMGYSF